jgi:hypothetical protein
MDDPTRRGQDRRRIALGQDYEVRYWTRELGLTREQLERAVREAGHEVEAVRRYLERRH